METGLGGLDDHRWIYLPDGKFLSDGDPRSEHNAPCLQLIQGEPDAVPVLLDLLQYEKPSVRQAAIYGLAMAADRHKSPEAHAALLSHVLRDEDWNVRRFAAWALRTMDPEGAAKAGVPDDEALLRDLRARVQEFQDQSSAYGQRSAAGRRLGLAVMAWALAPVAIGVIALAQWLQRSRSTREGCERIEVADEPGTGGDHPRPVG